MFLLQKSRKHIKLLLKEWNKKEYGKIFEENKIVEGKMQKLNQTLITKGFDKEKNELETKYHQDWENLCKQEEIFWRQKSRVQWPKEGDHNTRFFHKSTMANRAHNRISSIKDNKGNMLNTHEEIEVVLVQHFWGIAQETCSNRDQSIKDISRHIPKLVSKEDNFNLNRLVSEEEVGEDILNVVEDSRRDKTILKALNTTFIALIPKQDVARTPERFRLIALCNVVYKIISKVVANRLKPLLPTLVSTEQSGYVEGRKILDNIIQAHEVVHSLTNNNKAGMIMQLDVAKAYDKLNWTYIRKVLTTFRFDQNSIRWVMVLVTSCSFSILVNRSPSETFTPSRGLRQGDLLSPFIFILMMEGLGRKTRHAKVVGSVKGLQLSEKGRALTHQQFVDDTMLQGIPTVKEALSYKQILRDFSMASGLEVNLSKSKYFFFNTHIAIQRNIARILGFQRELLP
eukprot:PITA_10040